MIHTFVMLDRPHASKLHLEVRPERKAYLGMQAERITFASPLVDDEGNDMRGSLLAIDPPNRDAATTRLRDEPLKKAGLYPSVQIPVNL